MSSTTTSSSALGAAPLKSGGVESGCFPSPLPSSGSSTSRSMRIISSDLATEIAHTQEALQSKEYVRYGDYIKLHATSYYIKQQQHRASGTNGGTLSRGPIGGYLGIYEKSGGCLARLAVPPIGPHADGKFTEQILKVLDPYGEQPDGYPVRYSSVIMLVDDKGYVWNNKIGTGTLGFFEAYLGPKPRGTSGELYLSFQKNGHEGKPLVYGDIAVYLDVITSGSRRYNYRLTNFKSGSSSVSGGYVCSDGSGHELAISVHRYTGPPLLAYVNPVEEERLNQLARRTTRGSVSGNTFIPPEIRSVSVKRYFNQRNPDEGYYLDVMIKTPLYGTPVKLYGVTPDDMILVDLDQENTPAMISADHLFSATESAAENASYSNGVGNGGNGTSVPPLQLDIAIEKGTGSSVSDKLTRTRRSKEEHDKVKLQLTSVEMLVEQDINVLKRAFHDDKGFHDAEASGCDSRRPPFGKLDLLIAAHKLAMLYFTFAVVTPYLLWEVVVVIGDLIEPIHAAAERNKSLAIIERLATILVADCGIPVVDGKAQIEDYHRNIETTTLTTSMIALLISYAAGLLTPAFAREARSSRSGGSKRHLGPRLKSRFSDRSNSFGSNFGGRNELEDEKANWLISIQVPEGSWDHVHMKNMIPGSDPSGSFFNLSTRTIAGDDDDDGDALIEDEDAAFKVNGVKLGSEWGLAGVDDNGIPKHKAWPRFLAGEKGNVERAKERWIQTCEWRVAENVDDILKKPHPNFDILKQAVPNYYYGRDKAGHPIYVDAPGGVSLALLKSAQMDISHLLFHYLYCTEFVWRVLEPSENARALSILDLEGIGMWDLRGQVLDFIKKSIKLSSSHYPERANKIFIINAPRFFTSIWSLVKPFLDEATLEKVGIYRTNYKDQLLKLVDADQLPEKYGGSNTTPPEKRPMERLFESFVCKELLEKGVPMNPSPQPISHQTVSLADRVDEKLLKKYAYVSGLHSEKVKLEQEEQPASPTVVLGTPLHE